MKRKPLHTQETSPPGPPRLAYSMRELKTASSLGLTTLWGLAKSGNLLITHVGRRAIVTVEAWQECLEKLAKSGGEK